MQPSSLLAPVWGGSGSGRGGTAPYPNEGGSRPVSASDGWMDDQQAGGGGGRGGAGESHGGGGGGVGRLSYSGSLLGGAGGGGGRGQGGVSASSPAAPPGAHRSLVRAADQRVVVDPDLMVAASGVRTSAPLSGEA